MRLVYLMPSTSGNIAYASSSIGYQQTNATLGEVVSTSRTQINAPYNNRYDLKFGVNGIWLDGIQVHQTSVAKTTSNQMQLCAYQSGWSSNVHIYLCQFYENDELVKDLIPCYRKSDNVVGMYDIVNKEFIAKGGNGVMAYGNEIN